VCCHAPQARARPSRLQRTGHRVGAVKGELHVVLGGNAEDAPDVANERLIAARPAAHRHVVHLRPHGPFQYTVLSFDMAGAGQAAKPTRQLAGSKADTSA